MRKLYAAKLFSCVLLFVIRWTAAHQASLSVTICQSLLNPMFSKSSCYQAISSSVSSSSPPAFNLSQHQGLPQWVSSSHQVIWVLELQLQHQSKMNIQDSFPLGLTAVQGTLSLLQHHNSKSLILWHSAFFMVQHSHP